MQRVSWAGEPQLLGDQYDDLAQQSYWSPDNTGNSGSSALPYTHGNRSRLPIIVSAAIIAVLWTLLAVYACLPPWNRRRARAPSLRRLASRDDDECQELLASGTPASEEEGMGSSQPRASSEGAGFKWGIRLRKRGRSSSNAVDGEQAKKPLREEELRSEDNLQSSDEALPRLASGHAPSHLPEREELLLSSHVSVKTEGEASAETSKTTARVEDFGGPEWVDAYANAPPAVEDWFLSFLLDPSSTLSSTEKVKQPDGAVEQLDSEETQIASQTTTEDTRQLKEESIEQESLGTQQLSPAQPSTSAGMTSEPQRSESESLETSQHVTSHGHVVICRISGVGMVLSGILTSAKPAAKSSNTAKDAACLQQGMLQRRGASPMHQREAFERAVCLGYVEADGYASGLLTPKGPLLVVGCVDGALRVFAGRTLRLLVALDTTAVPTAEDAADCDSYRRSSADPAKKQDCFHWNPPGSAAAAAQERETSGRPPIRAAQGATIAGAAGVVPSCTDARALILQRSRIVFIGTHPDPPQQQHKSARQAEDHQSGQLRVQQLLEQQHTPTCLLLVGNNAVLAGLGGGCAAAFFLENCRLAAVYRLPPSVRCFLQQQQQRKRLADLSVHAAALQELQLQHCREQAARKWRGEPAKLQQLHDSKCSNNSVSQVQLALEDQLPVCCLFSAAAERLVVMAVHPDALRDTPLLTRRDSSRSSSILQRYWRKSTHAVYHRAPPPTVASAARAASYSFGPCCGGNLNAMASHQAPAAAYATEAAMDTTTAAADATKAAEGAPASGSSDTVASWPVLVFQQHTGACVGTLWGGSSRTLAMGVGKLPLEPSKGQQQEEKQRQQLCCLAVTTTHVHFWQQQDPSCSKRRSQQICSTQQPRRRQRQQANGTSSPSCMTANAAYPTADAAADASVQLEQQQLLHEKRNADAAACPSFLCGCRASTCQLAAATAAATAAAAAARQPVAEKLQQDAGGSPSAAAGAAQSAAVEGGCVGGVWWSLSTTFPLSFLWSEQQQQQQQQEESLLADAVLDWDSRLMTLLPSRSFSCCLLSWRFGDGGLELVPLRWVQVAASRGSPQKPILQRLWYNRGLLAASAADGYVRLMFLLRRYNRGLLAASAADGYVRLMFRVDLSTQEQQQEDVP
ncbi:hypothetical protein, conserved [Eimeria praecox]|uniref:Uncharacterized protein n=1 Tax=Eimeria praecox TaxID=51316 RepID=U6G8P0_9EIME|nr:hypothetical protein, conserved [Eimeria praecox]